MLLEAQFPKPDMYFWYAVSGVLSAIVAFFIIRWINQYDNWMKKSNEKFELLATELGNFSRIQSLQAQTIDNHTKAIDNVSKEAAANTKLATEMATMLAYLNGANAKDEGNPTIRRFRNQGK